jgi:hypothetical protein
VAYPLRQVWVVLTGQLARPEAWLAEQPLARLLGWLGDQNSR